jgi:hypothetical protein
VRDNERLEADLARLEEAAGARAAGAYTRPLFSST